MFRLSYKEIRDRMADWRNIRKLHQNARKTIKLQAKLIKVQGKQISDLNLLVRYQRKMIENQALQIEELRRMVFGDKKQSKDPDDRDPEHQAKTPIQRSAASYHRPLPEDKDVTKEEFHPISSCDTCQHPLSNKKIAVFYEEDIPLPVQKQVIKHTVEKGYCPRCEKARTGLSLPPTKVILGKQTKIYVCYLSVILNLSFEKIKHLLKDTYQLNISDGEISNILEKEAIALGPEYERLREKIRSKPAAHYDETGWPVQEEIQGSFGWVMTDVDSSDTVFLLGQSRGKGVAEKLKGDADHIGITDDYGAYRHLFTKHQLCWAHPLRKLRDLSLSIELEDQKRINCSEAYQKFQKLYQKVEDICTSFSITERQGYRKYLLRQFTKIAQPRADDPEKLLKIKKSLVKNIQAYFTCLDYDNIPLTNNKAERSLRPLVIKRRISFGSKTEAGAERTSILSSILLSLWWSKPVNFFEAYRELRV